MSNQNSQFTERDILQDCLSSQKFTTGNYNLWAGECVNSQLRSAMLEILDDEHKIQNTIFTDMNENGWYPVEQAQQQKIQQARQKFSSQP